MYAMSCFKEYIQRGRKKFVKKIKLFVDTGSDIPPAVAEKYDVTVIPLSIFIDHEHKKDYYELDGKDFCQLLRTNKAKVSTSQPSPVEFLDYFKEVMHDYEHIICFTMAPAGSGTYNSACLAKQIFDEEKGDCPCVLHIIDSKSCSLAEVIQVEAACELQSQGHGIETILNEIDRLRHKIATYYLVDNVDYLIRGGRVPVVKGTIAATLNLKPIVTIRQGEGSVWGCPRGYKKGVEQMFEFFKTEARQNAKLFISHSDCEDKAMMLINRIKEFFPNLDYVITQMFCTMATQAGPGTVAMFYERT